MECVSFFDADLRKYVTYPRVDLSNLIGRAFLASKNAFKGSPGIELGSAACQANALTIPLVSTDISKVIKLLTIKYGQNALDFNLASPWMRAFDKNVYVLLTNWDSNPEKSQENNAQLGFIYKKNLVPSSVLSSGRWMLWHRVQVFASRANLSWGFHTELNDYVDDESSSTDSKCSIEAGSYTKEYNKKSHEVR